MEGFENLLKGISYGYYRLKVEGKNVAFKCQFTIYPFVSSIFVAFPVSFCIKIAKSFLFSIGAILQTMGKLMQYLMYVSLNTSLNLTQIRRLNPRRIFVALVLDSMAIKFNSTQVRRMN